MKTLRSIYQQRLVQILDQHGIQNQALLEALLSEYDAASQAALALRYPQMPPAVALVRDVCGFFVDRALWGEIKEKARSKSRAEIEAARLAWIKRGYNPRAFGWLDWLVSGIPARDSRLPSPSAPTLQELGLT